MKYQTFTFLLNQLIRLESKSSSLFLSKLKYPSLHHHILQIFITLLIIIYAFHNQHHHTYHHPINKFIFTLSQYLLLSNFQNSIKFLYYLIIILWTTIVIITIFILFNKKKQNQAIFYLNLLKIGRPIILLLLLNIAVNGNYTQIVICNLYFFIISILWLIKIYYSPANFSKFDVQLSISYQFCRVLIYIAQLLAFNSSIFSQKMSHFIFISWSFVGLTYNMFNSHSKFIFISRDLGYITYVGNFLNLCFLICLAINTYLINFAGEYVLIIPIIVFLLMLKLDIFKQLFSLKYQRLIQKLELFNFTQIQYIIVLEIVRKSNYRKSIINFQFQSQLQFNIFQNRLLNKKQSTQDHIVHHFENILHKSSFSSLYFTDYYLQQHQYLKAVKISQFVKKNTIEAVLTRTKILYFLQKQQALIILYQSSCIFQGCKYRNSQLKVESHNKIISYQIFLDQCVSKVIYLFCKQQHLHRILLNEQIQQYRIQQLLLELNILKNQIHQLFSNKARQYKTLSNQFTILYYLFLSLGCSITKGLFDQIDFSIRKCQIQQLKHQNNKMVAIVSGEDTYIGVICQTNLKFRNYFNFTTERIANKIQHIDKIIPSSIRTVHNELILNFKKKSKSTFLGKQKDLIAIKDNMPIKIKLCVKMYPFEDGLSFICNITVTHKQKQQIILFNNLGQVQQYRIKNIQNETKGLKKMNFKQIFPEIVNRITRNNNTVIQRYLHIQISKILAKIQNQLLKLPVFGILSDIEFKCLTFYQNKQLIICTIIPLQTSRKQRQRAQILTRSQDQIISRPDQIQGQQWSDKIKSNKQIIRPFITLWIIPFFALIYLIFSAIYLSNLFQNNFELAAFYNSIANGFRTRLFDMNSRFTLLQGISNGSILVDKNRQFQLGQNLQDFIINTNAVYLQMYDKLDTKLLFGAGLASQDYVDILTLPAINFFPKWNMKISWASMVSYLKSFYHEAIFERSDWSDILRINTYLMNTFSSDVNTKVYKFVIDKSLNSILNNKNIMDNIEIGIYLMSLVFTIGFIYVVQYFNKNKKLILQLLKNLDSYQFEKRSLQIHEGIEFIKNILTKSFRQHRVDRQHQSIQVISKNQSRYIFNNGKLTQIQIHQQYLQPSIQSYHLPKSKPLIHQNRIKNNSFLRKNTFSIISVLFYWSLIIYFVISIKKLADQNQSSLIFYYNYVSSVAALRIAQSILINIVVSQVVFPKQTTLFNNRKPQDYLSDLQLNVTRRTSEDFLKGYADWSIVESILYVSKCNNDDELCKKILRSSMTKDFPAGILELNNLNMKLYYSVMNLKKYDPIVVGSMICQLQISYDKYLRQMSLNMQNQGLLSLQQSLQKIQSKIMVNVCIPVLCLILLLHLILIIYIGRTQRIFRKTKLQTLRIDRIQRLVQKNGFSMQFKKI